MNNLSINIFEMVILLNYQDLVNFLFYCIYNALN